MFVCATGSVYFGLCRALLVRVYVSVCVRVLCLLSVSYHCCCRYCCLCLCLSSFGFGLKILNWQSLLNAALDTHTMLNVCVRAYVSECVCLYIICQIVKYENNGSSRSSHNSNNNNGIAHDKNENNFRALCLARSFVCSFCLWARIRFHHLIWAAFMLANQ